MYSQKVEDLWGPVESQMGMTAKKVREGKRPEDFNEKDTKTTRLFFAMQHIRNPEIRDAVYALVDDHQETNPPPEGKRHDREKEWNRGLEGVFSEIRACIFDGIDPKGKRPKSILHHVRGRHAGILSLPDNHPRRFIIGSRHIFLGRFRDQPSKTFLLMPISPTKAIYLHSHEAMLDVSRTTPDEINDLFLKGSDIIAARYKEDISYYARRLIPVPLYSRIY